MRNQLRLVDFITFGRHHDGMNPFAPTPMGDANDHALGDTFEGVDGLFHFARIHVFAARYDHILEAIEDIEKSI